MDGELPPGAAPAPDIFFSSDDGLAESRHVFLRGNGLPGAWRGLSSFVISELGFGTGLNALAVASLVAQERQAGHPVPDLLYQTVEISPRPSQSFAELGTRWPELEALCREMAGLPDPVPGWNHWPLNWGTVRLFAGDAGALCRDPEAFVPADAWFFDGWAPSRDAALWQPELLAWAGRLTRSGGTGATYTAAGVVKQALRGAGFTVKRHPGWGRKRHMIVATMAGGPSGDYTGVGAEGS